MNEKRERIRCRNCELVQWNEQGNCRRCGVALPQPIVRVVERVVERVIVRQDPRCLASLEEARRLILTATDRLTQPHIEQLAPVLTSLTQENGTFPTMAEVERAMISAAYQKSNCKPLEAARLLGIGKTTLYRKLREMDKAVA
jgi:transcriptional regulator of acetoin/glycerol metabolism